MFLLSALPCTRFVLSHVLNGAIELVPLHMKVLQAFEERRIAAKSMDALYKGLCRGNEASRAAAGQASRNPRSAPSWKRKEFEPEGGSLIQSSL